MPLRKVVDVNVVSSALLPTPAEVKAYAPLSEKAASYVYASRKAVCDILNHEDGRLIVVLGPCSIHDISAAKEYAQKLTNLQKEVAGNLLLVMRVYFSKPRTTVGWKGLINDPELDDSFKVDQGLKIARKFLLELAESGVPVGTEILDAITPQYLDDLITWSAIGARTAESQSHREIASGLSTPVGIKNGTDGNIQVAINALKTMQHPHHFLGINQEGQCVVLQTRGNKYGHVILRGGTEPNYDAKSVAVCREELRKAKLPENIVIDCSHGNSHKDYKRQPEVFMKCIEQRAVGDTSIVGLMLESNLFEGRQDLLNGDKSTLKYGVSITDSCIDWETTRKLILEASKKLG